MRFGWEAEKAVERARKRVADLAGAAAREIVFTSGATESINLALKGLLEAARTQGGHIVTMATEHKATLDTAARLVRRGCRVTVLPPRPDGLIDLDQLRAAILPETVLVSVMAANNEIGVLQPVSADRRPLPRNGRRCSTATPPRPSARCRSTWKPTAST